jgi:hypothetical protein
LKKKITEFFQFRGWISIFFYIALSALLWYLIVPHTSLFYIKEIFNPISKRLNKEEIILVKGEEFRIKMQSVNKRVTFSSSDIKVADVNLFGTVTAYRPGTTIIKVKYKDKVLKCRVRVIDISKKKVTIKKGKSTRLRVKGDIRGVRWKSANPAVAKVNRFGRVTGVNEGTTKVYAKVKGKTLECVVKVY